MLFSRNSKILKSEKSIYFGHIKLLAPNHRKSYLEHIPFDYLPLHEQIYQKNLLFLFLSQVIADLFRQRQRTGHYVRLGIHYTQLKVFL